ncbi:MAG: methionine synthase [Candidatus Sumerlaeia bacterium]|nr:methionine synthase [Candidatus Sumerlaeia bacterium]
MKSRFLEVLNEKIIVFDGAMGTSLQAMDLKPEDFGGKDGANDYLCQTRPDVVKTVHRNFLKAGADAVETNSFGSTRLKLDEYGVGGIVHQQNVAAARLAREVCDEFATPERPRFVVGSMGPTGMMPSTNDPMLGQIRFDELAHLFREQARGLIEGGVDALLIETVVDALEARAAIYGVKQAMLDVARRVPIMVQASLDLTGRMLLGNDIGSWYWTLDGLGVDVVGMNCGVGPDYLRDPVRYLCENGRLAVSCIPNAGLPLNEGGRTVYPMKPKPFAELLGEFARENGLNIVGGCCGTTPDHIAAAAEAVRGLAGRARWREALAEPRRIFAASPMKAVALKQDGTVTLFGERLNAQGSKKVKELLLADNYDELVPIAVSQVDGGAHLLDVCTALTERADEDEQMRRTVKLVAQSVDAPLVIDSTEPSVIETALKQYPGAAVVNSINLENGRERIDQVMPLVIDHGASVIALTIDKSEGGMAKTADVKFKVAKKIYDICVGEYGLEPGRLVFDALTFTLATGEEEFRRSAIETIDGIRAIKAKLPGALTTLGVSNVSFGLPKAARPVVNSVFLHHCMAAGLDSAIINAAHVLPYFEIPGAERELADDLVYDRRPDALARLIEHFEGKSGAATVAAVREDAIDWDDAEGLARAIHYKILHRKPQDADKCVHALIGTHKRDAVETLNTVLLPAMKEVGDKFGAGELILPFVLQSAEVMKKCVAALEQYLEKKEGVTKGKLVLATVFGDVHDIGKNLVNTILTNNGYTVYDIGKQVPVQTIIEKAKEVGADAIGLSALLVSTSKQMPVCVRELAGQGLTFPVIIGGAAINRSFGRRTMFLGDDPADTSKRYAPGVFYAKDAFEGLDIMDTLMSDRRAEFVGRIHAEAVHQRELETAKAAAPAANGASNGAAQRSKVRRDVPLPEAPFLGWKLLDGIPLDEVWKHLDHTQLFRVGWGAKGQRGDEYDRTVRDQFMPKLSELQREAKRFKWLQPRVLYGFYPAAAEGNQLVVYSPENTELEIGRFDFPRQGRDEFLCLSDYVRPVDSGEKDMIALQVVTVGPKASELYDEWHAAGDVTKAYFFHGFATETAEALAAWNHKRLQELWGIPENRGKRYSFGYSACPNLEDHALVWRILPVEEQLGVRLTENFQLVPEQSTVAIVFHHPECVYYVV